MELSQQAQALVDEAYQFFDAYGEPKTGPSENNPIKGLGLALGIAYVQATWLIETIKLMEIPQSKWHIRQASMAHAVGFQQATAYHLEQHVQVSALLKQAGY